MKKTLQIMILLCIFVGIIASAWDSIKSLLHNLKNGTDETTKEETSPDVATGTVEVTVSPEQQ